MSIGDHHQSVSRELNQTREWPDRRRAILDAALRLFAERGVAAVSAREIAEKADVSVRLIWHHFGTKQGLQNEIDSFVAERMRAELGEIKGDIETRVEAAFSRYKAIVDEYGVAFTDYTRDLVTASGSRGQIGYEMLKSIVADMGLFEFPDHLSEQEIRHREIAILGLMFAWPLFRRQVQEDQGIDIYSAKEYKERIRAMVVAVRALLS